MLSSLSSFNFHHSGLALKNPEQAELFLKAQGYESGPWIYDPCQNVNLCLAIHSKFPAIELVTSAKNDGPCPLANILKNNEQLIYHTCYEVKDIEIAVKELKSMNFRLIQVTEKKPAVLFNGREVAFFMLKGFGLIELLNE